MQELSIRQEYNKNGFYVFKKLFNPKDIEFKVNSIVKLFGGQNGDDLFISMKKVFDDDIEKYKILLGTCCKLYPVYSLLLSQEISSCLNIHLNMKETIIPTGPVVHLMSPSMKVPNGYFGLDAHQDWTSMQGSLDSVVVWVPLVDINKDLYPLQVIPGSNQRGLLSGQIIDNVFVVNSFQYSEKDFIDVEVEAGDVVCMNSFTIHRSKIEGKNGIRASCSIRYENMNEKNYIDRNYPSCYNRNVNRKIITPNFPSIEQVNKVFK